MMRPDIAFALLLVACCPATAAAQAVQPAAEPAASTTQPVQPAAEQTNVVISTSMGDITIALDGPHAPATVANFLAYVKEGHYNGTLVYRVVPGFVIQAGSFDSPAHSRDVHAPVALEANNGLSNLRGTIAMAREDEPNSATAEFFINLADNTRLDHRADDTANTTGYTVFGKVVAGMDVVDKIAAVPLGDNGPMPGAAPVTPITIRKISLASPAGP